MPDIDNLSIKIEAESTQAAEKVNALAFALERLQRIVKGNSLTTAKNQIAGIGFSSEAATKIQQKRQILSSAKETVSSGGASDVIKLGAALDSVDSKIERAKRKIDELQDRLYQLSNIPQNSNTERLIEDTNKRLGEQNTIYQSLIARRKELSDQLTSGVTIKVDSSQVDKAAKKVGILSKALSAVKRIAFYRVIRAGMKIVSEAFSTGIKDLYQYSKALKGEFADKMDMLATSALYLKNSLGAMVSPLINAIAPAVDFLVDKFVDLLNIINQVFAALSGKTSYTRAIKQTTEYSKATDKAAKSLKSFTLGFDELNVIEDSVSSGTKAMENYATMFEEADISQGIERFAISVKDVFFNWKDFSPELIARKALTAVFGVAGGIIGWTIGGAGGAAVGLTLGATLGILLGNAIFNGDGIIDKEEMLKGIISVFALAGGGIIGFMLGGPLGAAIGITVAGGLTIPLLGTLFDNDGNISKDEMVKSIVDVLLVAGGGVLGFLVGGPFGAAVGMTLGAGLSMAFNAVFKDGGLVADEMLSGITTVLLTAASGLIGFFVGGPLGAAIGMSVAAGLSLGLKALFDNDGITKDSLLDGIVKLLLAAAGGLIGFFVGGPAGAAIGISIGATVTLSLKSINTDKVGDLTSALAKDADNITKGFTDGINNNKADLKEVMKKSFADPIQASVKGALGIHSPSTVFEEIAKFCVEGFNNGFSNLSYVSALFKKEIQSLQLVAELFTNNTANNFQTMSTKSTMAVQSIISSLNSIPRNITTVHTIITENVSGGSSASRTKAYASGGFPEQGQMFIAREAGPELVGTIGNKTAVANNDQIVRGIQQGVSDANQEQNALLREQNELLTKILAKTGVTLDGKQLRSSIQKADREAGVQISSGGVLA